MPNAENGSREMLVAVGLPGKPTQLERVTVREHVDATGQRILVLDGAWIAPRPSMPAFQAFSPRAAPETREARAVFPTMANHLVSKPGPIPPQVEPSEAPTPPVSPPEVSTRGPVELIKGGVARRQDREVLVKKCAELIKGKPLSANAIKRALGLRNNMAAKRIVYELIERGHTIQTSKGRKGRAGPGRRPVRYSLVK